MRVMGVGGHPWASVCERACVRERVPIKIVLSTIYLKFQLKLKVNNKEQQKLRIKDMNTHTQKTLFRKNQNA